MPCVQLSLMDRRGSLLPWSWSYRKLAANCQAGVASELGSSRRAGGIPLSLSHLSLRPPGCSVFKTGSHASQAGLELTK